ncbi:MAG: oligosaccharide flippase family protein [Actinobacteria bacterium]|nr:oligosaccharide flippase family protein [Actinomycetota bacterium]MCL5887531.1 oligosaccharide flippase family protein [Actinomycetota bacterium]
MNADEQESPTPNAEEPSENRTSVLRGSFTMGLATLIAMAASLLITLLVAHLLGPDVKGQLTLLQTIPLIAALILSFGFEGANAYFVGRHGRSPRDAVADSLALTAGVSIVGIPVIAVIMREFMPALAGVELTTILLASATLPLIVVTSLVSGVLTGQGRITGQAVAIILASVLFAVYALILLFLDRFDLHSLTVATLISAVTGVIISLVATGVMSLTCPSLSRMREQLSYAGRQHVQTVAGFLEMRQDLLFLGVLASPAAVGIYSIGVSFAELAFYAPAAIAAALTARTLQEDAPTGAEISARITRLLVAILAVMSIVLVVVAEPLVVLVFGEQFAPASIVIAILIPSITLWGVASQPAAYLSAHGVLFPKLSIFTLILNLVLNIAMIPPLGILGAAIATAISYAVSGFYIIGVFMQRTGIPLSGLLLMNGEDVRYAYSAVRGLISRKGREQPTEG